MICRDLTSLLSREVECGGDRYLVIRSLRATVSISSRQPAGRTEETSKVNQLKRETAGALLRKSSEDMVTYPDG
ncbi:hypothetical protein CA850_23125 [Micromonospora echinospora]|nr:hypothetical protein CA850_23125 [Micromonospora echinospora]